MKRKRALKMPLLRAADWIRAGFGVNCENSKVIKISSSVFTTLEATQPS
jgi:hypothetical protein